MRNSPTISPTVAYCLTALTVASIIFSPEFATLNKLISDDFNKGIPLGKVTVLAGESGAGKSYIAAGNVVKAAQDQGIFVILIDIYNSSCKCTASNP